MFVHSKVILELRSLYTVESLSKVACKVASSAPPRHHKGCSSMKWHRKTGCARSRWCGQSWLLIGWSVDQLWPGYGPVLIAKQLDPQTMEEESATTKDKREVLFIYIYIAAKMGNKRRDVLLCQITEDLGVDQPVFSYSAWKWQQTSLLGGPLPSWQSCNRMAFKCGG